LIFYLGTVVRVFMMNGGIAASFIHLLLIIEKARRMPPFMALISLEIIPITGMTASNKGQNSP